MAAQGKEGFNALHWAVDGTEGSLENRLALVKGLLEHCKTKGVLEQVLNARDKQQCTPLYWAVDRGYKDIAAVLLEAGANINVKCRRDGHTLLHRAVARNNLEMAEFLVAERGKYNLVNAIDKEELSPLHWAVRDGNQPMAALLLQNKAKVNQADYQGYTPLHWAADSDTASAASASDARKLVELLIGAGADPSALTKSNETPIDMFGMRGDIKTVELLMPRYWDCLFAPGKEAQRRHAFAKSAVVHEWLGLQKYNRFTATLTFQKKPVPHENATLRQFKDFIREVNDDTLKKQAIEQFDRLRKHSVLSDKQIKKKADEIKKAWREGKYDLIDKKDKTPDEYQALRYLFDHDSEILRWLGFEFAGVRGGDQTRSFTRHSDLVTWGKNSFAEYRENRSAARVNGSHQAQALALFATSVSATDAQEVGLKFLSAILNDSAPTAAQAGAALIEIARRLDDLNEDARVNAALNRLFASSLLGKLDKQDVKAIQEQCRLEDRSPRLRAKAVTVSGSGINQYQDVDPQILSARFKDALGDFDRQTGEKSSAIDIDIRTGPSTAFKFRHDDSRLDALREIFTESSSSGKSSPPDEFRSSTMSSTKPEDILRDRVRGIELEKRRRKINLQLDMIGGAGIPPDPLDAQHELIMNRMYFYEMTALSVLSFLHGATAKRTGFTGDSKVSTGTAANLSVAITKPTIRLLAKVVNSVAKVHLDDAQIAPVVSGALSTIFEKLTTIQANMAWEAIAKIPDNKDETSHIENLAFSLARGLTLLHLDDIDNPTSFPSWWAGFMQFIGDKIDIGKELNSGRGIGESEARTKLRLMANKFISEIIHALIDTKDPLQEMIKKNIALTYGGDTKGKGKENANDPVAGASGTAGYWMQTDHLKIEPILRWHCEKYGIDTTSTAFRNRPVWQMLETGIDVIKSISVWRDVPDYVIDDKLRKRKASLKDLRHERIDETFTPLKDQVSELEAKIAVGEKALRGDQRAILQRLASVEQALSDTKEENAVLKERVAILETESDAQAEKIQSQEEKIQSQEEKIQALTDDNAAIKEDNKALKVQVDDIHKMLQQFLSRSSQKPKPKAEHSRPASSSIGDGRKAIPDTKASTGTSSSPDDTASTSEASDDTPRQDEPVISNVSKENLEAWQDELRSDDASAQYFKTRAVQYKAPVPLPPMPRDLNGYQRAVAHIPLTLQQAATLVTRFIEANGELFPDGPKSNLVKEYSGPDETGYLKLTIRHAAPKTIGTSTFDRLRYWQRQEQISTIEQFIQHPQAKPPYTYEKDIAPCLAHLLGGKLENQKTLSNLADIRKALYESVEAYSKIDLRRQPRTETTTSKGDRPAVTKPTSAEIGRLAGIMEAQIEQLNRELRANGGHAPFHRERQRDSHCGINVRR
jgi:hypothetical protein